MTLDCRRALAAEGVGLAFVLIAFLFAAEPLLVAGIALCAVGALTPLWVLAGAAGARARRVLVADRVTEGAELHMTIAVHRSIVAGGWGRLEITDPLTGERLALGGAGSPLLGVRDACVQLTARMGRRGEHTFAPPAITARDPFDLARAESPGRGAPQTVLVLPRTEPVQWTGGNRIRASDGEEGRLGAEAMAATDVDGLRPYRPGSPASRIHWPALARGQGLIERQLRADGDERPLVMLDPRTRAAGPGAEAPLDAAVRAAASLVLDLARRGGCMLLLPGQSRATVVDPELSAWPAVHARLAVAGTAADPHRSRPPALERLAGRVPLIYVTATPHERLGLMLGAAGRGPVVLVVPDSELRGGRPRGIPGASSPVLTVSGCLGFALRAARRPRPGPTAPAAPHARGVRA
ncbi:MAG TPA: DUF58 domain-containing protein [Solirubrobacteraceae bacterium]|nr:DUF58 domain-containing protein [Solirubrobacteraceae bacterium]